MAGICTHGALNHHKHPVIQIRTDSRVDRSGWRNRRNDCTFVRPNPNLLGARMVLQNKHGTSTHIAYSSKLYIDRSMASAKGKFILYLLLACCILGSSQRENLASPAFPPPNNTMLQDLAQVAGSLNNLSLL